MSPLCRKRLVVRGFTFVELLIVLLLSSIIGTSVYFIVAVNHRLFHAESRITHTQAELRYAMESLKSDIKRAAFIATTFSQTDPNWCGTRPSPALYSVYHIDYDGGFVHQPAVGGATANEDIHPDQLYLFGCFDTTISFYSTSAMGNKIFLSTDSQLLVEPFPTQTVFESIFDTDHFLRVVDQQGNVQIHPIASSSFGEKSVTVKTTYGGLQYYGAGKICGVQGSGAGMVVNPVQYIRYRIVDTFTSCPTPKTYPNVYGRSTLVREVLTTDINPSDAATRDQGSKIVSALELADNIIDLQFWFTADSAALGAQPIIAADTHPYDFVGNVSSASVNQDPSILRAISVRLAARSPLEERDHNFQNRTKSAAGGKDIYGPITSFKVNSDTTGSCRVRSLTSTVELKNFSYIGGS